MKLRLESWFSWVPWPYELVHLLMNTHWSRKVFPDFPEDNLSSFFSIGRNGRNPLHWESTRSRETTVQTKNGNGE